MTARRRERVGLYSMTWRLFACTAGCVLLLLAVMLALNTLVLKSYYVHQKEEQVRHAFTQLDAACRDQVQLGAVLEALEDTGGLSVVLWSNGNIHYSSHNRDRVLLPYRVEQDPGSYTLSVGDHDELAPQNQPPDTLIQLVGTLGNGWHIALRTPVAAIEDSIGITNRFLLVSGGIALLCSLMVSLFVSRRLTRPLRHLTAEADRVAKLDFSGRHHITGRDEVAQLGHSIRTMSVELERTITQLQAANQQLLADIDEKERQDAARRSFIANVSHELKTPLALMSSYAECLEEGVADSESRAYYCGVIQDEAKKTNQLLRRMTTLMQLESGGEPVEPIPFNLTELLHNMADKYAPALSNKAVTLQLEVPTDTWVKADPYLMENVLQNYWQNALNHVSDSGTITVSVTPAQEALVEVTVFNTGTPIPTDELSRIWESFHKVDKARTREYGGSGIGLSVVAAIMNAHGLPYGVINRDGGVAFFIRLPKVQAPE